MTTLPLHHPRLLSVAEFAALAEDTEARYELQEGAIVMAPRPNPDHQLCLRRLGSRLEEQVPSEFDVLPEVDVDLGLTGAGRPGTVRAPDVVIVPREARRRVRAEGGLLRASEVLLVVEVVSPGSRRMDTIVKRREYADAGIEVYWVVDIEHGVSLLECRHVGTEYRDSMHTGVAVLDEPFVVRLHLDALL